MLFSYVEIPLFSWQHSRGSTETGKKRKKKKKKTFADTLDKI
jgi:hypothetical protein